MKVIIILILVLIISGCRATQKQPANPRNYFEAVNHNNKGKSPNEYH